MVDELEGFKDFNLTLGMFSATTNVAKSAQGQLAWGTLKYHQKLRFWCFPKKASIDKKAQKHVLIIWIFTVTIFYMPFLQSNKKMPLYVNFSIPRGK
jgi:hypothetical protein